MPRKINKSASQKAAEGQVKKFEDKLGPFVVAAETTRMAMIFLDAEHDKPVIFANDSFLTLTGYPRDEVLGQKLSFLFDHAADAESQAKIDAEFSGKTENGSELHFRRKDGSEFWVGLLVSPVRDEKDKIVQYFASFVDLSHLKDEQTHTRALIDELNHRVKNTLSVVQAIVWQGLRSTADPKAARAAIESRLFALSRSHDLLTKENWKGASLREVVSDVLQPFSGDNAGRIISKGKDMRFSPKATLALSVALNELATNAVKYGALSNGEGKILISWKIHQAAKSGRVILKWKESGGPKVVPPTHKGFGSGAIERGLALELQADVQLEYKKQGLVCTIDIPAANGVHIG